MPRAPRIIPNPFDNTILVQGTPQEWEQIKKLLEQIDILWMPAEFVISHERAERFSARRPVFFLVDFFENGALIEFRRRFEILEKIRLADVHQLDLQAARGFRLLHEVVQTAPRTFQLLERFGVHHFVQLLRNQLIQVRDPRVDHGLGVVRHRHLPGHDLFDEIL